MCKTLISVGWQGDVFDCDFNQMLGLTLGGEAAKPVLLSTLMETDLTNRPIRIADHCYGATAWIPAYAPLETKSALACSSPTPRAEERRHLPRRWPLANYLSAKLNRPVELRTVDSWEGLAKSLANGETDFALMGPWGYVLANHQAGAQVISTILYDGKPEYFAIMVTHPNSGINSPPISRAGPLPSATRARPRAT
jgi:hypothetical protein